MDCTVLKQCEEQKPKTAYCMKDWLCGLCIPNHPSNVTKGSGWSRDIVGSLLSHWYFTLQA